MNGSFYDRVKLITHILLPTLGALYFALSGVWDLPAVTEALGITLAVVALLGVVLRLSSSVYHSSDDRYAGAIFVGEELGDGMQNFKIQLPLDAQDIVGQNELVLKVQKHST